MHTQSDPCPLCVDLDGTLIKSDLLVESVFALLKKNLFYAFLLPSWLLQGKANLKQQIATRVDLDPALLPYNEELLDYLRHEKENGRRIILATATNTKFAQQVAAHLGLFDAVLASSADVNLSGRRKLAAIQAHFDGQPFDYAGNDYHDLAVWRHSRKAIVVSASSAVRARADRVAEVVRFFNGGDSMAGHLRAMRPHQWAKNLLVFLPLLAAHEVSDTRLIIQAVGAFLAFSLCASSVYLLNDLLDLPLDRHHPRKRKRPYASGAASVLRGAMIMPVLLLAALGVSLLLPGEFLLVLIVYYTTTLLYSLKLKNVVLVDVLLLAGLYTVRIIAGAAAVSIMPSFWLLAFGMFIFFSLAMVKRYSELQAVVNEGGESIRGRGYQSSDLEALISFGGSSGYMAVLVLALYINSDAVREMYTHPEVIWLLCPLLLYWVSRMWLVTRRGEMHDDPLVYAIKDRISRLVLLACVVILAGAL